MRVSPRSITLLTAIVLLVFLSGCADLYGRRTHRYMSSVVDYLYPKTQKVEVATVPRLALPLKVGVAFVPAAKTGFGSGHLDEKHQLELMERISAQFRALPFVTEIELIPSPYLTPEGSFANLDQIRTMYGIDVIVLLSYDQVQHTDEGLLSLSYWTLVGAYVIKGEKNDTSTMIDAAVYDIPSRKMLFRAPGTSRVKASATLVNLSEQLRLNSKTGFQLAADNLVTNLKGELERFKQKVKEMPQQYQVVHKAGYTGGGSLGGGYALLVLLLGGAALWRNGKRDN